MALTFVKNAFGETKMVDAKTYVPQKPIHETPPKGFKICPQYNHLKVSVGDYYINKSFPSQGWMQITESNWYIQYSVNYLIRNENNQLVFARPESFPSGW